MDASKPVKSGVESERHLGTFARIFVAYHRKNTRYVYLISLFVATDLYKDSFLHPMSNAIDSR